MTPPTVLQYQTIRSRDQCHSVGRSVLPVLSSCVRCIKMDNCSNVSSSYKDLIILEGSLKGTGVLICSLAIILSFALRLHKLLTYRLAIYQVSSSLAYGTLSILSVVRYFMGNDDSLCLASAYLVTYTFMVKYLFTIIITIHLFFFAVCYINFKRLEVCYLVISLVVPAALAAIPFATNTYGSQSSGSPWCWIQQTDDCPPQILTSGVVEIYVLLYGPIFISLLVAFLLISIMLGVLAYRICVVPGVATKNKTVIKQMLPLTAYPIIFYALMLISMVTYIYDAAGLSIAMNRALLYVDRFAYGGFIWASGLTLLLHISVMLWSKRKYRGYKIISNYPT